MRRRALLTALVGGIGAASGCLGPFTDDAVALQVENATGGRRTVDLLVGGTVRPESAPEGKTPTLVGREEVTFERTVTVGPGETRRFESVLTYTDAPRNTGLTVDVHDGPRRRVALLDLHTDRNLVDVAIGDGGIDVDVRQK